LVEGASKRVNDTVNEIPQARARLDNYNVIGDALESGGPNIQTGMIGGIVDSMRTALHGILPDSVNVAGLPESAVIRAYNESLGKNIRGELEKRGLAFTLPAASMETLEGTKALLSIAKQIEKNKLGLGRKAAREGIRDPLSWSDMEDDFYEKHPIVSPFTGKPITGEEAQPGAMRPEQPAKPAEQPKKYKWTPEGGVKPY
jgi:hypothetical protein